MNDPEHHEHYLVAINAGPRGLEHIEPAKIRVVHLIALEGAAKSEQGANHL